MNPPGGRLDGRTVAYGFRKEPHRAIQIDTKSVPVIDFWCAE